MTSTASGDYPHPRGTNVAPPLSFDIVVATVGRTTELDRLFESLASQSLRRFRVIVVDQNPDDRLDSVLARHAEAVPLIRIRSTEGLARARNAALRIADADIVAFADDDCWYPSGLLAQVADVLEAHPEWAGITGRVVDEHGRPSAASF